MLAPLAVSVDDEPTQMEVGEADTVTDGSGLTVMVTVAVLVHPAEEVPVTVYVVVTVGVAVTEAPVDALRLVEGDQE